MENYTDEQLKQALADAKVNLFLPANDNVPESVKASIIKRLEDEVARRGL